MNKGEMKRLGDYIREVDVRNRDLEVTKLLGVSISKEFMPSIANTIGTDMSSYKIVEPRQFAYGPVTSRNGDKVSIALYKDDEKAIVSQAYTIFEVKNKQELLPEYLMMWFRRPEFDRYARFKSHGSAREIFSWEEMCDVELPVPPIEQQQKIVSEYEAITHRIRLNEQIITKLEETAQTLYRKMFVDGIDKENLPEGWRMGTLGEVADFTYGKMPDKTSKGDIPIFSGYGIVGYTNIPMYKKQLIIVIARGDAGSGKIVLSPNVFYLTNLAIAILLKDDNMKYYLYYHLLNSDTSTLRSGSAQAQVTINSLFSYEIIIPSNDDYREFDKLISLVNKQMQILIDENMKLTELQSLLLAKMGQGNMVETQNFASLQRGDQQ
ncbi:restriction endonuclease subunit S [Bacteroides gallinaceum]|uniref:restriction endonuclease subunit S n=1 Tax=Bacteroides gallinaceum TaxID=1462571 RepID=UPI0025AAA9EB|nr:restriction endonuclease subunit S [Bacteroides gallinaceum]MDN0066068.1 restriction endonuclease subunit S [Bacteroides gallinaceum]